MCDLKINFNVLVNVKNAPDGTRQISQIVNQEQQQQQQQQQHSHDERKHKTSLRKKKSRSRSNSRSPKKDLSNNIKTEYSDKTLDNNKVYSNRIHSPVQSQNGSPQKSTDSNISDQEYSIKIENFDYPIVTEAYNEDGGKIYNSENYTGYLQTDSKGNFASNNRPLSTITSEDEDAEKNSDLQPTKIHINELQNRPNERNDYYTEMTDSDSVSKETDYN